MYVAGIDIGGTFTDCAIIDERGAITVAKVSSTPDDFSRGFFGALEAGARAIGLTLPELLGQTSLIAHGTTVATNVIAQYRGARVGMLTTAGHADALAMMRARGRIAGLAPDELMHYSAADKPSPLVPSERIGEIHERVDSMGEVVVHLDEAQARQTISRILEAGVDAIGVSFLWSFMNPAHEQRVQEIITELAPDVLVTTSHELVPRLGEYERSMAVAINSYVAPAARDYLHTIGTRARELGYRRPILLMECSGGVAPADRAAEAPVRLIGSGPAGGIVGAQFLGERMGLGNVITTDMGGTTFDVALIVDGQPVRTATTIIDQREYYVPTLDMRSIGAGGGSIAWFDERSGTIKVGPHSAGAEPGPVAYGRGGTEPTVTDANLLLGYLNPAYFLNGTISLDLDAAMRAYERLGARVGVSALEAAAGVVKIVDFHMADLIRKMTVEKGHDPRNFTVFAYGGGGPLHGAVYARELGAKQLVVPLGQTASVWSALGVATSDVLYVYEQAGTRNAPWDAAELQSDFEELERRAATDLVAAGLDETAVSFQRILDTRYRLQVHSIEVPVPNGALTTDDMSQLQVEFERRYEQIFGAGTGYSAAGVESSSLRLRAIGATVQPVLEAQHNFRLTQVPSTARKPSREVWWHELGGPADTAVFDGSRLAPGHVVSGPAVIELPETTVLVRPKQEARVDGFKNFVIDL
jgi:N-methylhydantoinase A